MTLYRALKSCFHNSVFYDPGRVFEAQFEGGKAPSYLAAVEPATLEEAAPVAFKAIHKGNGKWSVFDADGNEIDSGLTRDEAQVVVVDKTSELSADEE